MTRILAIMTRELRSYFVSPIAYIITSMFLMVNAILFIVLAYNMQFPQYANYLPYDFVFLNIQYMFFLMAPLLTMKLFAEEKHTGTIELLMTSPVTEFQVVLGKFLAVLTTLTVMLLMTLQYPLILLRFGNPDVGAIISGYVGLFLFCMPFIAIGLFTSTLTKNQIIASVLCFSILMIVMLVPALDLFINDDTIKKVTQYLSVMEHYEDFVKGIIDTKAIVFYLSLTIFFLFLSVRSLETAKWK